jgi:hypothetical protein
MLVPTSTQKFKTILGVNLEFIKKHLILLFTIAYLLKIAPLLMHPTLWAEDANVFYGPLLQEEKTFLQLLGTTYAGQYFTFQFIIAKLLLIVLQGKILYLPLISTLFCICATYALSLTWLNSRLLIQSKKSRILLFGFTLLAPSSFEPLGTLCGLHNYFLLSLFAMAGWNISKKRMPKIIFIVLGLLSVMTSINGVFLLGSLILSGYLNKKYFWLPILSTIIIVSFQIKIWLSRAENSMNENFQTEFFNTFLVVVKRIGAEIIVGQNGGNYLSGYFNQSQWIVLGLVPIFFFTFLIFKANFSKFNWIPLLGISIFTLFYFGLVIIASRSLGSSTLTNFNAAGRYFMVIHVLTFAIFLINLNLIPKMKTIIIKSSICVLMTFFAMGMVSDFLLDDKSSELTRTSWKNFSKCLEVENKSCQVVVPPGQFSGNWGIALR